MSEIVGMFFVVLGFIFSIAGSFALVRLKDPLSRLAYSIKGVCFGSSLILFGAFLLHPSSTDGIKAILCAVFLLLTSPVVAHSLAAPHVMPGIASTEKGKRKQKK